MKVDQKSPETLKDSDYGVVLGTWNTQSLADEHSASLACLVENGSLKDANILIWSDGLHDIDTG